MNTKNILSRFSTQTLSLELQGATAKTFRLTTNFLYYSQVPPEPTTFTVEPFATDLTTVPWPLTWGVKQLEYAMPAVLHDYLISTQDQNQLTWQQIDAIYQEALEDQGIGDFECQVRYWGVRLYSIAKGRR